MCDILDLAFFSNPRRQLFHEEFTTSTGVEGLVQENSTWAVDGLRQPSKPLHHRFLHVCYQRDIPVNQCFDSFERCIILDDDNIGFDHLNLPHDDVDERVLLLDLVLNIQEVFLVFLNSERVRQQKDPGVHDLFLHPGMSYRFLHHNTVHVLAFRSVFVLDQLYFDVFGDIDRIIAFEGPWAYGVYSFDHELRQNI